MKQIFLCVLSLSLSGALTGAVILMIRPFTRKFFSKSWNYYIWLLLVARLLIPVHVDMGFSSFITSSMTQAQEKKTQDGMPEVVDAELLTEGLQETEPIGDVFKTPSLQEESLKRTVPPLMDWGIVAGTVWILGAAISFFIKIGNYRRFMVSVRKECEPVSDRRVYATAENLCAMLHIDHKPRLYESKAVSGPITVGMWRTAIVLPLDRGDLEQLPLILHHELVHVKRRDLWYKWLYQILLCIHWFNPVLYLIGRKLNIDCELACDEAVLGVLTQEGKRAYGNILLDAAQRNISAGRNIPSVTLLERKEDLKDRLKGILQYKKKSSMKALLSCCMAVGLLFLSACGSIQLSSDVMEDDANAEERSSFWDGAEEWMNWGMTSSFLDGTPSIDQNGEAWQVYDDDEMIAGEDIEDQWRMYSYMGGKRIECKGMFLNGAATVLVVNTAKDMDIEVNSVFKVLDGRFKLVYVDPQGEVTVINDAGQKSSIPITMKTGRNVIKLVGQEGKIEYLKVNYSGLREKELESIYYSEEDEKTAYIKADIQAGIADKDTIMEYLYYLDAEDISQALAVLLKKGEELSLDELYDLLIYSDSKLSGRYLLEAIKNGETEPLSETEISEIKYYLEEESLSGLLEEMNGNLSFDLLYDCAPYLDNSSLEKITRQYLEAGGEFTEFQWNKLSAYLKEDAITDLKPLKPLKPI
ncbi:MAG: M56 family metallopeptidase [Lachnospiraceae bacterium]|nr:M56 family metallopeptidase [Lachnospiraceae bacterium]